MITKIVTGVDYEIWKPDKDTVAKVTVIGQGGGCTNGDGGWYGRPGDVNVFNNVTFSAGVEYYLYPGGGTVKETLLTGAGADAGHDDYGNETFSGGKPRFRYDPEHGNSTIYNVLDGKMSDITIGEGFGNSIWKKTKRPSWFNLTSNPNATAYSGGDCTYMDGGDWAEREYMIIGKGLSNGTPYGNPNTFADMNEYTNNGPAWKYGHHGAIIIEYDGTTEKIPDPTPQLPPPSPGHTSIDWTFPDLSSDPRFILSRFSKIIDIAEAIDTNTRALGDIYYNPVISIGGRYNLPIPDSMKVSRHKYDSVAAADGAPMRVPWNASAEKPLSVNNINMLINIFNNFSNGCGQWCPDMPASSGTDMIDTISPDQVATFHFFYQVRDKFARWEAYINNHMGWWDGNDLCARSCQVTCQTACQAACQGCNNSTCHNQNCGGWS